MKSLISRLSHFDAVKKILKTPAELDALMDRSVEIGDDVVRPLGLLRLLYGVPFHYLVPDERMLPAESIRFFHLDPDWMSCLLQGALSPGRSISRKADSLGYVIEGLLLREADKRSEDFASGFRAGHLGLEDEAAAGLVHDVSGVLLRSDVLRGWKNLGMNAYPLDGAPTDAVPAPLKLLRFERLAPDILLALFKGAIHRLDVHEAPQGLHFGVDPGAAKALKYDAAAGAHRLGSPIPDASIAVPFRDAARRVVDVARLARDLRSGLDKAQGRPAAASPAPLASPDFALQMIQGVGMVTFLLEKAGKGGR